MVCSACPTLLTIRRRQAAFAGVLGKFLAKNMNNLGKLDAVFVVGAYIGEQNRQKYQWTWVVISKPRAGR